MGEGELNVVNVEFGSQAAVFICSHKTQCDPTVILEGMRSQGGLQSSDDLSVAFATNGDMLVALLNSKGATMFLDAATAAAHHVISSAS